jgi:hypothetical protein
MQLATPRAQPNHIAAKLHWAQSARALTPARLVEVTGVKGESAVSEWKRTGRIAKRHIPVLAAETGTSERWWLMEAAPVPPTAEWLAEGQVPALAPRELELVRVWRILDQRQQAEALERIKAEAARNIEIAQHLRGLNINGVVPDGEVGKHIPPAPTPMPTGRPAKPRR